MDEGKSSLGGLGSRRLAAAIGVVVLAVLLVLGWAFYRQLASLFRPTAFVPASEIAESQDVRVQRGPITKVLRLLGTVHPGRQARLAFQAAKGRVVAIPVQMGQEVEAGQTLIELDTAALQRDLVKAQAELQKARRELAALLEERGLTKRIQLQEELRQARLTLDQAKRDLQAYEAGKATPQEKRAQAAAALAAAQAELAALRESEQRQEELAQLQVSYNLAENEHGPYVLIPNPSEQDLDKAWLLRIEMLNRRDVLDQARLQYEMDIRAAEQEVVLARRALATLDAEIAAGSPASEQNKRKAAVLQAEAQVQQLQAQLVALDEVGLDVDVAKAQAAVLKLEGKVADAEAAVREAVLVAPFAGVVEEIKVEPGATVSPGSEVVSLFSTSSLYVLARVNEVDIAQLQAGQTAEVTFEAFPGQSCAGQVGEIPSFGTYENGLTVFDVRVTVDVADLPLRLGMSATIQVPLFRKEDVVIVPTMAVQQDGEGFFVILVEGTRTERRRVRVGISDGINVEILEGLESGDVVRALLQGPIFPR